ncbi:tumor necrosis factor receptor superfamily member 10A-like isoform X2 [Crotalus tigris]|uniref:tumor necrosis factor receptor superfamily member 10A-like isoform X2 n=1 Tax=Crotalus tigris TaxID=88082 RepID=UPI00192F946E|nr:tumor necrosis factor receptor superfamily member 10A-like isoform X2 [Crotalus tigris]
MRAPGLLTLCSLAYLLHEVTLTRLPQIQNPMVTAPTIPDDDTNNFYTVYSNRKCQKCPPGTFVFQPCAIPRSRGTCRPCENNTFSKLPNSFKACFSCRACRSLDEVEVKRCTATTDTECACKNGTFCLPDHACETCSKCTTSCDPGEKKVQDCTPTSDIKCVPDTTSSPPTSSPGVGDHKWIWLIVASLALGLFAVLGLVWCWKKNTSFRNACTGFWSSTKRFSLGPREERDNNMLNMQRNQRCKIFSSSRSTANGQAPDVMIPLRACPPEEGQGCAEIRKLVPENGRNAAETLSRAFDNFINKVPSKDWRRFMRLLNLTDNEIDSAANFSQYANEQHYQMLRTWLDKNGQAATLSVLLEVLNGMDLKGIAEEVTKDLVAQRLYVYEE